MYWGSIKLLVDIEDILLELLEDLFLSFFISFVHPLFVGPKLCLGRGTTTRNTIFQNREFRYQRIIHFIF